MSLRSRANLLFLVAALVSLALAWAILGSAGSDAAIEAARGEAAAMTKAADVAGQYTREKIAPLFDGSSGRASVVFVPASAPFYAVETQARLLAQALPGTSLRRVVLDPVGAGDRPDAWEREAIAKLRASDDPAPFTAVRRDAAGARVLTLVTPLRFSPGICATCYASRAAAPVGIVDAFGGDPGFDRKSGEIVGITAATVPLAGLGGGAVGSGLFAVVVAIALMWIALNVLLQFAVLRPLGRVTAVAEQVSLGKQGVREFETTGRDEVAALARSFNRLRRSMESAIGLIDR